MDKKIIKVDSWGTIKSYRFRLPLQMICIEKISCDNEILYVIRYANGNEVILTPKQMNADDLSVTLSSGFNMEGDPATEEEMLAFFIAFRSIFGSV